MTEYYILKGIFAGCVCVTATQSVEHLICLPGEYLLTVCESAFRRKLPKKDIWMSQIQFIPIFTTESMKQ